MTYEHNLFVYRPLQPESESKLQSLQNEYASVHSFKPVENLHLTLLNSNKVKWLNIPTWQRIKNDAPKTSAESFDTQIVDTRLEKSLTDLTRVALKLILDSEESTHYFEEHYALKQAAEKIDEAIRFRPFIIPYVTLGHLDTAQAVESVKAGAESLVGNYLSFSPTESNVGKMYTPVKLVDTNERPEHASTPSGNNSTVRTIKPGGMPKGLLGSLRPRS